VTGFGGTTNTGSLFGGGGNTSGGFGNTTTSSAPGFSGFGGSATATQNNGTGTVQFSEVTEKDASASNQINKFQSITTMDAYKPFSFEELRVTDYSQNRKQGSANGQAGGFGTGSSFGGFGGGAANTAGGFGNNTTGGGLFGQQNQTASTGFGSGTTGGIFGAAKPATGGLFGGSTTTSAPVGGSLFGTSGNTGFGGGGFGNNTTSGATTGSLFGTATNQQKSAFGGGFGGTNTGGFSASTGSGFGGGAAQTSTGGGLFGNNNTTSGGFGATQQPASTGFSFGQNNQTTQQPAQTGSLFGGGGGSFGQNNQQKPTSLFGNNTAQNTGTSLFGNNNQPQQTSLFGNNNQQPQQSSLFSTKPAGSLFGNNNTGATGGGLFGNNNQQQANTGGLFGNNNNQQSSLFGPKPAATGGLGSSLFGNPAQSTQPAAGGSLFGNPQQNQPLGGSLFGSSQTPQLQPQQPGTLTANLLQNPYGNDALFANIGTPAQSVGPIATPLASSQKNKKQALIPAYKLSPAASSRLTTPQKRPVGYGFTYSTYGTPGSALPGSPFGFSNMLSPPYGRSLNKSMSTSNLRNSFSAEDSILNPNAFSSTVRGGTGRLKKLNVDRNLNSARKPLFGTATPEPRKSVSFDTSAGPKDTTMNGSSGLTSTNGALVRTESPEPTPETETNGASRPNVFSGRGKELAVVPEDNAPESAPAVRPAVQVPPSHADKAPAGYWMKPTIDEIRALPRNEQTNFKDFKVGCKNSGEITFSRVDFTTIALEKILGDIVKFETRKVSVYGDDTSIPKPPVGQGLNVPSTIILANSWPRSNAGATEVLEKKGLRFDKHVNRLKRIPGTEFVKYDANTGEWTFKVEHYTTYGLPDDFEDDSMLDSTMVQDDSVSPTPLNVSKLRGQLSSPNMNSDASLPSPPDSSPDDTFDFKKGKRKQLPGQFDDEGINDYEMYDEDEEVTGSIKSFLGERSVGSSVVDAEDDTNELGLAEDQEMAGSFPLPARTTEPSTTALAPLEPKSILKNSTFGGTPLKTGSVFFGDDWTEQLQRTVSPRKQDRAALRANQAIAFKSPEHEPTPKATDRKQPFATSMDIMNSLFSQSIRNAPTKLLESTLGNEVCGVL
jgi:nuclear pore complex protein Nup98-Nup96